MRIVLLGDLHVYRLWTWPWHLLSKRLLGQTNLWLNRRSKFDIDSLPEVVEKALDLAPDLAIHTGDLTTTALMSEFDLAGEYLQPLLDNVHTLIVPGNHDRYTFASKRKGRIEQAFPDHTPRAYPDHREIADRLHLIALDPTKPNFFNAAGRLTPGQTDDLAAQLDQIPADHRVIIVCHYPIAVPPGSPSEPPGHGMKGKARLIDVMKNAGHEMLYLHGHIHEPWCWRHDTATNVAIINAGAPVMKDPIHVHGQGFWQIDVDTDAGTGENPWSARRHVMDRPHHWTDYRVPVPRTPGKVTDAEH